MAEAITWSLGGDNTPFREVMRETQAIAKRSALGVTRALDGTRGSFRNAAKWATGLVTTLGLVAATAKGISGLKSAFDDGGALSNLSASTGIAVKDLVVLRQAFKNNGLEVTKLAPAVGRMQAVLGAAAQGGAAAREVFTGLGLDWQKLAGQTPMEQFAAVQKAIASLGSQEEKVLAARKLFGNSGSELLALFANPDALADARAQVGDFATEMDKQAAKFDAISNKIANLGLKFQQFFAGLGGAISSPLLAQLENLDSLDMTSTGRAAGEAILKVIQLVLDGWAKVQQGNLLLQAGVMKAGAAGLSFLNKAWDIIQRVADAAKSVGYFLAAGAATLAADMAEAISGIAKNLRIAIQYALEKAIEGASKHPLIARLFGSFKASSFADISKKASGDTGWMKELQTFARGARVSARASTAQAYTAWDRASGTKQPLVDPLLIAEMNKRSASLAEQAGSVRSAKIADMRPKSVTAPLSDADLRKYSGVSERYFAQLTGMYGGGKGGQAQAMSALRESGLIRESDAQAKAEKARSAAEAKSNTMKFDTLTPETVGVDILGKKVDNLISVMEEAWLR
jgi:hypothetical protein